MFGRREGVLVRTLAGAKDDRLVDSIGQFGWLLQ
jgi:hypothetical protein